MGTAAPWAPVDGWGTGPLKNLITGPCLLVNWLCQNQVSQLFQARQHQEMWHNKSVGIIYETMWFEHVFVILYPAKRVNNLQVAPTKSDQIIIGNIIGKSYHSDCKYKFKELLGDFRGLVLD